MLWFTCFSLLAAAPQTVPAKNPPAQQKKAESFKPFTGKVIGNKVRIRAKPDVESHIIKQVGKNELLLVVGENDDFYAVEPMKDTKAYVFRSYVLDGVVEANRVNVRLEPHVDAPIIGQLRAGDKVEEKPCALNNKWLEIPAPKGTVFYVAKEFISHAGGPEFLAATEKRKSELETLLSSAYLNAEAECKKTYEQMNPEPVFEQFQAVLRNFADFPEAISQAKDGLALLKETYLNKKIAYLESKAELSSNVKQELLARHEAEKKELLADANTKISPDLWARHALKKEGSNSTWEAIEDALFISWTAFHSGKKIEDFYAEQKANATVLEGSLEKYTYDVIDKPGEFLLRKDGVPCAYLYSTQVDLKRYEGQKISVVAAPRPNHNFAFPAYFVFSVE
jgi:hypothetical protein